MFVVSLHVYSRFDITSKINSGLGRSLQRFDMFCSFFVHPYRRTRSNSSNSGANVFLEISEIECQEMSSK